MTLEEAIDLANQGDLEAMAKLAAYYAEQDKMIEAGEWACKAASGGYVRAMLPAASSRVAISIAKRTMSGGDSVRDQEVDELNEALQWIRCAKENGIDCEEERANRVIRERGLCAYFASCKDGSSISSEQALEYLREGWLTPGDHLEADTFYGIALYQSKNTSESESELCFNLLKRAASCSDSDLPLINLGVVDGYLGFLYLEGEGCAVDENTAYECFVRAGERGVDCSDILSQFKKKIFGGYVFVGEG